MVQDALTRQIGSAARKGGRKLGIVAFLNKAKSCERAGSLRLRDWAADETDHRWEFVEVALARVCRRTDLFERRHRLMADRAEYFAGRRLRPPLDPRLVTPLPQQSAEQGAAPPGSRRRPARWHFTPRPHRNRRAEISD